MDSRWWGGERGAVDAGGVEGVVEVVDWESDSMSLCFIVDDDED
jgi:hypothetical protein